MPTLTLIVCVPALPGPNRPLNFRDMADEDRTGSFGVRRLVVRPRTAREMLGGCGLERLYRLLNAGELESFRDGRARYITVASIESYIARRLADAGGTPASSPAAAPPRQR